MCLLLIVFFNCKIGVMLIYGMVVGLFYVLLLGMFYVWFGEMGVDFEMMGVFLLIGLVYVFKFLWLLLVD